MLTAKTLLEFATLCNLSYETDPTKVADQASAMGFDFTGLITNGKGGQDQGDCQAYVLQDRGSGVQIVIFRGTSVASNFSLSELWDDSDTAAVNLGAGVRVMAGFFTPLSTVIGRIFDALDFGKPIIWLGHSKGGSHVHLVPAFLPRAVRFHAVTYGAPMCGNPAYWDWALSEPTLNLVRVEVIGDFAPHHPPVGDYEQPPIPFIGLTDKGIVEMKQAAPFIIMSPASIAEHSIDGSYMKKLSGLLPSLQNVGSGTGGRTVIDEELAGGSVG